MAIQPTDSVNYAGSVEKAIADSNICDKFYAWTRKVTDELVAPIMDAHPDWNEGDLFDDIREGLIKKVVEEFENG